MTPLERFADQLRAAILTAPPPIAPTRSRPTPRRDLPPTAEDFENGWAYDGGEPLGYHDA